MTFGKIIRLNESNVRCPICHEFFVKKYDERTHQFILACDTPLSCKHAIAVGDPFIGKWDMAHAKAGKIECVACGLDTHTRYFATSTGYVKVYCAKKGCGAVFSNAEPDRDKTKVAATPDKLGTLQ